VKEIRVALKKKAKGGRTGRDITQRGKGAAKGKAWWKATSAHLLKQGKKEEERKEGSIFRVVAPIGRRSQDVRRSSHTTASD